MMTTTVLGSAVATCNEPLVPSPINAEALLDFRAEAEMWADDSLLRDLQLAANCDVPVLLSGADPKQAEDLALAIHRRSARRESPFVVMDARWREFPTDVLTLLRRVASGRTSDDDSTAPGGGTLFITHVEKMSFAMQIALLRFLDRPERRRRAGLRIITASDAPAIDRVASGQFRAELYYRLNVLHIAVALARVKLALRTDRRTSL